MTSSPDIRAHDTAHRTHPAPRMVAVTSGTISEKLAYLRESCHRFGLEDHYVELGVGHEWTGYGMRWRLIREWMAAENLDDETWVVFSDGFDTACQQPHERILEVLSHFDPGRLVVSAELYPWPEDVFAAAQDRFGVVDGGYKFPCAGQYAGTRPALEHLYDTTGIQDGDNDQGVLVRYLMEHPDRVQLDVAHRLFLPNLYRLRNDVIQEPAKKWTKKLNRDYEVRVDPRDAQPKFFHKGHAEAACFVHSNGCRHSIERLKRRAARPAWWPFP